MFAELLGKKAGYCKGKGGSMHIADPATGNLGANAIVCGSAGIATGAAFSAKRLANGRVSVCFIGEGALGQGVLYEVMNLAELFKLPVIYVCENNLYSEYTHFSEATAGDILARATGFGVHGVSVDGQNVRPSYAPQKCSLSAPAGGGLGFLLGNTYRYRGHHVGDMNREYTFQAGRKQAGSPSAIRSGSCRRMADRAEKLPTVQELDGYRQGSKPR